MPVTGDSQNDNTQFRGGTTHSSDNFKSGYKIGVIRSEVLQGNSKAEPGPPSREGYLGKLQWSQALEDAKRPPGEKRGGQTEQWPWLQTCPFRQHETLLPSSSDQASCSPYIWRLRLTTLHKPTNKWSIQDSAPLSCPYGNCAWCQHAAVEISGVCCCFMVRKGICDCRKKRGQKSSGTQRRPLKNVFLQRSFSRNRCN